MKGIAGVGISTGNDGQATAMQAAQIALDKMRAAHPVCAIVIFSSEFSVGDVLNGLSGLLGETPLWGFSTSHPLSGTGEHSRTIIVALLAGDGLRAQARWWQDIHLPGSPAFDQLKEVLKQTIYSHFTFVVADEMIDLEAFRKVLEEPGINLGGGLSCSDIYMVSSRQIGRSQGGESGLAALLLGGRFRVGIGTACGWEDVGLYWKITATDGRKLVSLDGLPAVEIFSNHLGGKFDDWVVPPLSELARLYPLGIETAPGSVPYQVCSPTRIGKDGSLLMNAIPVDGAIAHLLIGDRKACQESAASAATQALASLGKARPLLAVIMVDTGWRLLFGTQPGSWMEPIREILGDIPIVGAYTGAQIGPRGEKEGLDVLNQHLIVYLIGEA